MTTFDQGTLPGAASRPAWVRLLDIALAVSLMLLASAVLTGGVRVRFGDVRFTAESPVRVGAVVLALLAARTFLWRRESWGRRAVARARAIWTDRGLRIAIPWVLTTRLVILLATYVGVIVVGYPGSGPPFRSSPSEFGNLFARWDAGWYVTIAEGGYNYWGNSRAQTNVAFFPAYPFAVRTTAALLGARWGSPEDPADSFEAFTVRRHVRLLHAGWLVSVGAFTWALVYLFRLARDLTGSDEAAAAAVALTATYPFALFSGAVYTEGLFRLCVTAAPGSRCSRNSMPT